MFTTIRMICGLRIKYLINVFVYHWCIVLMCQAQNQNACNREPMTWLKAQEACVISGGVPAAPEDYVDEDHVWSPVYVYLGETVYGDVVDPDGFVCSYVDYRKPDTPTIEHGSCLNQHHYFCEGLLWWYTARPATWPEAAEKCPNFWDGDGKISVRDPPNLPVWLRRARRLLQTTFSERYDNDPWTCIQLSRFGIQRRISCDIRLKSICQFPVNTALPAGFHTTCNTKADTTTETPTTETPTTIPIEDATTTDQSITTDILINNHSTDAYTTTAEELTVTDLTTAVIRQPEDIVPDNMVLVISLVLVAVLLSSAVVLLVCFCWKRRRLMKCVQRSTETDSDVTRAPEEDVAKRNSYSSVHMGSADYYCENGDVFTSFSKLKHFVEKESEYDVTNAQKPVLTDSSDNIYNKLNVKSNAGDSGIFNDDSASIYNITTKGEPETLRDSTYNTLSYQTRGLKDDELYGKTCTPLFYPGDGTYGNLPNTNIESTYDCASINRNGPKSGKKQNPELYGNMSIP